MTGDERDRILGLLSTGPATVARLAVALELPGGVVSYQLRLLEQEGLARPGTMRGETGATTPVWVSTAAAASPPLRVPVALPGLTWTGDGPYPIPVWTTPHPSAAESSQPDETDASADEALDEPASAAERHAGGEFQTGAGWEQHQTGGSETAGTRQRGGGQRGGGQAGGGRPGGDERSAHPNPTPSWSSNPPERDWSTPTQRRPARSAAEASTGPRLVDVRRVPVDDATFYEFATRLDALAREFAARATPGAPATELTIALTRPTSTGYGS